MADIDKLLKEIEDKRTYFKTDSYPMSIGELSNLYENNEIIIRPEYQRLFRWTHGQKTKLVESLLLGIPIPSIFVYQDENGIWELVDGLQRVSTILQFMGKLENEEPLVLTNTKYLPSLDGVKWDSEDANFELPDSLKLTFKRSKLNFTIILSESDSRARFEVFQRLNTGGSNASNQEIRNSVMIMLKPTVYEWFTSLSTNIDFQNTISISDRLLDEQYHVELALRFIALLKKDYNKNDLGDFLDEVNEELLTDENVDFEDLQRIFTKTFGFLNEILGEKSFKKFDGLEFKGKFLESAYEAISIGIASNIDSITQNDAEKYIQKIKDLHSQPEYTQTSGSGSNARTRIPKLIPFAKEYFQNG